MHAGAEAFFSVGGPVFAVEADEDGRVGNGHRGFQDEDVELLAGFVDSVDYAFVRQGFYLVVAEHVLDLFAIGRGARRVGVGYEGKFGVHVYVGADVDGVVDGAEDVAEDVEVRGVGLDGFDAR